MDKVAEYQYNKGERAYMSFQGNMFLQDIDGNMWPVYSTDDASVKEWHALRAYQDAERKKGVPIEINAKSANSWLTLSYGHFLSGSIMKASTPGIDVFDTCGVIIGRFTNFRWRAGYPKGGQNG